jgi:predicted ATPase/DNA-binding SARP family transcriptional activator
VTVRIEIQFAVLGPLDIHIGGRPLPKLPRRQRALLVRLLQDPGRVVSFDALAESVWHGEQQPADQRGALYTVVSRVRGALREFGSALATHPTGYALKLSGSGVDAVRFERGVRRARELAGTDPAAALTVLDEALTLWRGRAFEEFADTFARPAEVRLQELRVSAQEERIALLLKSGAAAEASGSARALVSAYPLRERAWLLLMRALAMTGRQAEALDAYQQVRSMLVEDLGVEPSGELAQLHQQILQQQVDMLDALEAGPAPAGRHFPTPLGSFVGRGAELAAVGLAFEGARVVTLTGPGGIGKTRLAIEYALAALEPSTTCWVDLTSLVEQEAVPYAFCDALNLTRNAHDKVFDILVTALGRAELTLVVDNCEHVIDTVATLIHRLAEHCPRLTFLATSREPLAIVGEQVIAVGPLPLTGRGGTLADSDAIRLLRKRIREAVDPRLDGSELSERALGEITERLDGMPLALELAAARAAALGVAELAQTMGLWQQLRGRRGGPQRHQDLGTLFDWSYDLLSEPERILIRRLSVFPDWFSLGHAEQLCGATAIASRVSALLASLIGKSLVVRRAKPLAGDRAYRLLVPIRQYAATHLATTDEVDDVHRRHAELVVGWTVDACAELGTSAEPDAWNQLLVSAPSLRAVHAWCRDRGETDLAVRLSAALHRYAYLRDDHEILSWAETALQLPGAREHPLRPVLLASSATRCFATGDYARARALAEDAVATLPPGGAPAVIPLIVLADLEAHLGQLDEATAHHRLAWQHAVAGDDLWGQVEAGGSVAVGYAFQRDQAQATAWLERCLAVLGRSSAPTLRTMTLYCFGMAAGFDDPDAAEAHLMRSYDIAARIGATFMTGSTMSRGLTSFRNYDSDLPNGLRIFETAIREWQATGNRCLLWVTLYHLVPLLVATGEDEAAVALHAAVRHAAELPSFRYPPQRLQAAITDPRRRLGDRAAAVEVQWTGADLDTLIALAMSTIDRLKAGQPVP